jgi:hypothetical protein
VAVLHELTAAARLGFVHVLRACPHLQHGEALCVRDHVMSRANISSLIPFGFVSFKFADAPSGKDTSGIFFRALWTARASGKTMADSRAAACIASRLVAGVSIDRRICLDSAAADASIFAVGAGHRSGRGR